MHAGMKLGRVRPRAEQLMRAPSLETYLTRPLLIPPTESHNSTGAPISMFGNNHYGNCTFAALANYRAICSHKEGGSFPTTSDDVIRAYLDYTGGKDEGAVETSVLDAAVRGISLGGQDPWKIATWVTVDLNDVSTCKALVDAFWSIYLGVELPIEAQGQETWDVGSDISGDKSPGSWGGHALLWSDFDADGMLGLATWGTIKKATEDWLLTYADQGYIALDEDRAYAIGVDWEKLIYDIKVIT